MAERNATVKLAIKPDSDPAAPMKAVATASKSAAAEAKKHAEAIKGVAGQAKNAEQVLTAMMTAQAKKAKEAEQRVNELANALKRVGATTQQVQQFARTLGREFQLTTTQINQALTKAGQMPVAGRANPAGGGGRMGRGFAVAGQMTGLQMFGPEALGATVVNKLTQGASEAQRTTVDDTIKQQIRESNDSAAKFISTFHDGIPILQQARDAFTQSARAAAEASERAVEGAKARLTEKQERIRGRVADQIAASDTREFAAGMDRSRLQESNQLADRSSAAERRAKRVQSSSGLTPHAMAEREGDEERMAAFDQRNQAMRAARAAGMQASEHGGKIRDASAEARRRVAAGQPEASAHEIIAEHTSKKIEALKQQSYHLERAAAADRKIADSAMEQARIMSDLKRARAAQLQQQSDEAKARATRTRDSIDNAREQFGSMTEDEQGSILQTARRFKESGIGALTPEELGRLRGTGLFNEDIAQQARDRGGRSGFDELGKLSGAEARAKRQEDLSALLKQGAEQVSIQASVQLQFDTAEITETLRKALEGMRLQMKNVALEVVENEKLRAKQGQFAGFQR